MLLQVADKYATYVFVSDLISIALLSAPRTIREVNEAVK